MLVVLCLRDFYFLLKHDNFPVPDKKIGFIKTQGAEKKGLVEIWPFPVLPWQPESST